MKNLLYILTLILLFSSCTPKNKLDIIEGSSKEQSELLDIYFHIDSLMQHGIVDKEAYSIFIEKTLDFYREFPEESAMPKMLWSAGITAMTYAKYAKELLNDPVIIIDYARKSIQIFDIIQKVYPDYENVKNTHLYRGVIYDDILEDYENAKYEYMEYINKYPNDSVSHNLKEYIKYIGISADEIYKSFNISE